MIVTGEGVFRLTDSEHRWEDPRFEIAWAGPLFIPGEPLGESSIRRFADAAEQRGLPDATRLLAGHFFVALRDKRRGSVHAFVDAGGVFDAFRSRTALSTSFLELIRHDGLSRKDISPEAIVEFVNLGYTFEGRTFLPAIDRVPPCEVLTFSPGGDVTVAHTRDVGIDTDPGDVRPLEFFEKAAQSFRDVKVSLELTGGFDSRLVATVFDHFGLPFEAAVAAWKADLNDIAIARRVAGVLGHEFHVTLHRVDDLENVLQDTFRLCDGLCDIFVFHRLRQHYLRRLARGIGLVLSGLGGELYRDFWWIQDFPRYRRKQADLGRLLDWRILPVRCPDAHLTAAYAPLNRGLRDSLIQRLSRYALATNTQTYDNVYYRFKVATVAGRSLTTGSRTIPAYAPLLELDLVRHGFRLPRRLRAFDRLHRRLITDLKPAVAKMRVADGVSASARPPDMLLDLGRYGWTRARRLKHKVAQRIWHRPLPDEDPSHPDLWPRVRGLAFAATCLGRLRDEGILAPDLPIESISNLHLGKWIVVAMLLQFLDGGEPVSARGEAHQDGARDG